jgi:hypothetical protein
LLSQALTLFINNMLITHDLAGKFVHVEMSMKSGWEQVAQAAEGLIPVAPGPNTVPITSLPRASRLNSGGPPTGNLPINSIPMRQILAPLLPINGAAGQTAYTDDTVATTGNFAAGGAGAPTPFSGPSAGNNFTTLGLITSSTTDGAFPLFNMPQNQDNPGPPNGIGDEEVRIPVSTNGIGRGTFLGDLMAQSLMNPCSLPPVPPGYAQVTDLPLL